uniref:NADH-ubiquinone oxidoreductase chain 5 n=1 Tax=Proasellus coiffaiti TaxID=1281953 RepID=A0A485M7Z3_9CRUS|nr:NADH dehydrogenase subunit 5 [Proasellus coiffaiti]
MFFSSLSCFFNETGKVYEIPLYTLNSTDILLTFYFDGPGLMFLSFVLAISSAVLLFSGSYMKDDFFMARFTLLVLLFVLSMSLLILSLNMVSILLGWDGLGVVSYILVVYYQNEKSNAAGMITALTNRLGDVAILLTIGLMVETGSWNFMYTAADLLPTEMWYLGILIMAASITKSAQMPFSAWLPAAMAAPTPVSALVHSSTLVTAGVYLLIRFNPLIMSTKVSWVLVLTACLTTVMASMSALWECDLKKVVALSTLSQLGVMVMTAAAGLPLLALFHLLAHATFKALLFMCSGKIIHSLGDTQDIRNMGGLMGSMPLTVSFFNLANLALCGFPFLAGFYSKDLLIEVILMGDLSVATLSLISLIVGLSSAYSVRLAFLSFLNYPSLPVVSKVSDEDRLVVGAYLMLGCLATTSGAVLSWLMLPSPSLILLPPTLKITTALLVALGAALGVLISANIMPRRFLLLEALMNMWLLPSLSGYLPSSAGLSLNKKISTLDLGWAELVGGKGGYTLLTSISSKLPKGVFAPMLTYQLLGGALLLMAATLLYSNSLM